MEEGKSTVRSVERALDVLLCFTDATELGLSEIANRIGLHKSTVHRLLAALEVKGFLQRNSQTEKYRLGFRVWELSANLTRSDDPAELLLPEMEQLRDLLGETISIYVRDQFERIRIQAVQSNQPIRRVAPVGVRMSLAVGASSKVLVAFEDQIVLQGLLQDKNWPDSVDQKLYQEQLQTIRDMGYATSSEEREVGAAAVSAPIFDTHGHIFAALSVSGPSSRMTEEKMKEYATPIMQAAFRMGKMLK
ncbi:IclR family transcriptional regulator [Brevibacillus daliensis]|uniref:IclR family transcriptional regulator n=1 Tax=Brevibacillus daliensis TaxID=2892995 RepID=UPI001E52C220|nr:IclR family transcriptional regulator [Brevibacillus daliensis]